MSVSAFSQAGSSSLQGTVTDKSGGVVQGATITVIDVARGTNRVLTTDGAGEWVATNVIPGTYTVRAESKGFSAIFVSTPVQNDLFQGRDICLFWFRAIAAL